MLDYIFPPYSVGEATPFRAPAASLLPCFPVVVVVVVVVVVAKQLQLQLQLAGKQGSRAER